MLWLDYELFLKQFIKLYSSLISIWTGVIQPYADSPPENTPIAHLDLMQSILALSMIGLWE